MTQENIEINADLMVITLFGQGAIRSETEAQELARRTGRELVNFTASPLGIHETVTEDMTLESDWRQTNLMFVLEDLGNLRAEMEWATRTILEAVKISPQPHRGPDVPWSFDQGIEIIRIHLCMTANCIPQGEPEEPEMDTYQTEGGTSFHNSLRWERMDDLPEDETDAWYNHWSTSILPVRKMPEEQELLAVIMGTYTVAGLRLLGDMDPGED